MEKGHRAPYPAAALPFRRIGALPSATVKATLPIRHIPFNSRGRRPGKVPIMITLLLTVFLVVLISAICSMTEAALYSVPWTYIENLRKQGSATGELLYQLRSRIDQPSPPSSPSIRWRTPPGPP